MPVVLYEKKDKIGYVTINRPEAMNALNREVQNSLREVWGEIEEDADVFVAILTGAGGKAFSAGADLKEGEGATSQRGVSYIKGFLSRGPTARELSKPLIAAIDGYCLAGGLELALACDIRIASERASFGCPETRWSLLHGYGALVMPWTVHLSNVMELLLTGERIDAQEAWRIGLVSRVVAIDKLMSTAEQIASQICEKAPLAVRVTKELARRREREGLDMALKAYYSYLSILNKTEDFREGSTAFREKRHPAFKGR